MPAFARPNGFLLSSTHRGRCNFPFCQASPKTDADEVRRLVTLLENGQIKEGPNTGGWSDAQNSVWAVGAGTRFAILALDAAHQAGFDVHTETWLRIADYWLTHQEPDALSAIAGLAIVRSALPKTEKAAAIDAALQKAATLVGPMIAQLPLQSSPLYTLHCLERAGHLSDTVRFGEVDWQTVVTKQLLETQGPDGSWKGSAEANPLATGFALLILTGSGHKPANIARFTGLLRSHAGWSPCSPKHSKSSHHPAGAGRSPTSGYCHAASLDLSFS